LTRALGLKIGKIVIDAGHGGHDTGTIGPNGLLEKDVVLDVAKRLGRLLESRLGAEVIYTRQDDTFIPLETRTAIANRERADLFISIHANSSRDADARGVETYYLNFTSSPEALEVAARENAVSEKSIYELQDLVKKIALKEKIEESREFAGDVQESLYGGLALNNAGIRNRGIKKAPFIVLIGANMPSILAEISFVSNPTDERKLETSEHRQRIAESLYRGVSKYVNGLSGVKGGEQDRQTSRRMWRCQAAFTLCSCLSLSHPVDFSGCALLGGIESTFRGSVDRAELGSAWMVGDARSSIASTPGLETFFACL
jgi:N-acetylmuramoyl-L-alanine amidase